MAALEERAALTGEASHLFRIRRTLLKMLKKRSYVVDAAQLAMTPRGFVDQFGDQPKRNDLTILAEHETTPRTSSSSSCRTTTRWASRPSSSTAR